MIKDFDHIIQIIVRHVSLTFLDLNLNIHHSNVGVFIEINYPIQLELVYTLFTFKQIYWVPGMFASLDCMHYEWKNCPLA
jgi:hypothetical protein